MNNQSMRIFCDMLDAATEVFHYLEQDGRFIAVKKGDVEIRIDSKEEEGAKAL